MLHKDEVQTIFSFLSFSEQFAACLVFKHWNSWKTPIKTIICQSLAKIGIEPIGFCKALKEFGTLLTGSFLLWVISGFDGKPNDIDLVSKFKKSDRFMYWMFETWGTKCENDKPITKPLLLPIPYDLWDIKTLEETFEPNEDREFYVSNVQASSSMIHMRHNEEFFKFVQLTQTAITTRYYPHTLPVLSRKYKFDTLATLGNEPVVINHLHQSSDLNSFQYIAQYFDLDFVKMAFDGEKLFVHNWESIWNRSSQVNWNSYMKTHWKCSEHLNCYKPHDEEEYKSQSYMLSRLQTRQKMYKDRNFNVMIINADHVNPDPTESTTCKWNRRNRIIARKRKEYEREKNTHN
jgi:hypothetical protein